jgi:hypothetical protein
MQAPSTRLMWRHLPSLAAAIFGLWWFGRIAGGWSTVWPTHIGWLLVSDWGAHQLGWMFFRNDPWAFPIGRYRSLLYPVGSTLGFSDSIPAVAIVAKVLSPLLPRSFQYIGPWLASCFMLQGLVGAKIAARFWPDLASQAIAGMLFVTAPTLLLRVGHPSLCAHWLLLVLISIHLQTSPGMRSVGAAALITLLSATIHPYLSVMTLALTLALLVRVRPIHRREQRLLAAMGVSLTAGVLTLFWLLGYLGAGISIQGGNFDRYGADLTTFFNPMGYSFHLPSLPLYSGAYEGFAYLGAGLLLLTAAAIVLVSPVHLRRPHWRAILPLGLASTLLAIFAAGPAIRFAGVEVVKMGFVYTRFHSLVETFRSSGRFIWPLYYLCITFAIAVAGSLLQKHRLLGRNLLFCVLLLQIADLNYSSTRDKFHTSEFQPPTSPAWELARGDYDHLALHPPQINSGGCGAPFDELRVYSLAYLAYNLGLTINSAYLARLDLLGVQTLCRKSEEQEARGILNERTIYIVATARDLPEHATSCGTLDGYVACVAKDRTTPFSRSLVR